MDPFELWAGQPSMSDERARQLWQRPRTPPQHEQPPMRNPLQYQPSPAQEASQRWLPPAQFNPNMNYPQGTPMPPPQQAQLPQSTPQPQRRALPRATGAGTGQISNNVGSDEQQYNDLMKRRQGLEQEQMDSMKPIDYSSYDDVVKQRRMTGEDEMLLALAAQNAGMDPFAKSHMGRSDAAREQMKVTGGVITPEGFVKDVGHEQELAARRLDARIKQIDGLLNENLSRQQRAALQAERIAADRAMREMMAGVQQAIAQQASADRRYATDSANAREQKFTGEERSAQGYLSRMRAAEQIINDPKFEGAQKPGYMERAGSMVGADTANFMRDPARQQAYQAQEDWVRAKLRKESGAVIGDNEMAREISTYFPTIWDSPQVIEQKRASRREAERQMEIMGATDKRDLAGGQRPPAGGPQMSPVEQRARGYLPQRN